MPDRLETYRAQLRHLRSEVGFLTDRMHKARDGLVEQTVKTRATINESRELMKRVDDVMDGRRRINRTGRPASP